MKATDFEVGDGVCFGDYKSTKIRDISTSTNKFQMSGEFICINPLDTFEDFGYKEKSYYNQYSPRRADINVSEFRNFLFEMDSTALEDQLKILESCKIPFFRITFSGSKSYHAILSVSGGVDIQVNTKEGVDEYKRLWKRIQAYIDTCAIEAGFELPDGKTTFIDTSCQNPSRLTRFGGVVRSNGNVQEIVHNGPKMSLSDFKTLISKCPVLKKVDVVRETNFNIESKADFWKLCPIGLKNKIKYVDWAGSEGMYPIILKLTYWAIDSTGVDKDTFLDVLWDKTFIKLIEAGYPEDKLTIGVDHAYNNKRRS